MVVGSGWGQFGSLKFETVWNDSIFNSQKKTWYVSNESEK